MSDSTTQKKINQALVAAVDDNMSKFEKELQKKVRNKQKKIKEIEELEKKVKKKEIVANAEQQEKISSKKTVQAEIDEVNGYAKLYAESTKGQKQSDDKMKKQHEKDLVKSQTTSVRTFANMLTLHMLKQSGQKVPEELDEGLKHFSDIIDKFTGKTSGDVNWRQDRDVLINDFKALVTQSKDLIDFTEITYEDLNTGVAESISSNNFPEIISFAKPEPVVVAAPPKKEEKKPESVAKKETVVKKAPAPPSEDSFDMFEPDFGAAFEAEPEPVEEAPKVEETPAEKTEAPAEGEEGKRGGRGRGGRGRGRGERGAWRGADGEERPERRGGRGAWRGADGEERPERRGGRGGERGTWRGADGEERRGGYRGRGDRGRGERGRGNWRGRNNGVDAEGFETVKAGGDRDTRGRGRGRGAWRGADGEERRGGYRGRGTEGGERGGERPQTGRGRGERPPRRGAGEGGDLPGVATATTEPAEAKE